jgi:signal transduction histidine kinase/DNA-binding response OmpR family regulator
MRLPLLVLLSALPLCLTAQAVLPITLLPFENLNAVLKPDALVYKDKGRKLNLQQAYNLFQEGKFQPYKPGELPSKFEFGQYQFWLTFVLKNSSTDTLDLIVSNIYHSDTIWRIKDGVISVALCIPKWFPAPLQPKLLPYDVKALGTLRLLPNQRDTFFAQTYRTKPGTIIPNISLPDAYELQHFRDTEHTSLLYYLFFGIISAIFLFAVTQYVQHRDKAFLWYALYLAVLLFATWRNIENDNPWLYSTTYFLSTIWTKVFQTVAYFCCYTLFVYHFLKPGVKKNGFMQIVVRIVLSVSLLECIIQLILLRLDKLHESWLFDSLYSLFMASLSILFLGRILRNSGTVARLVFIGTLCALLGEITSTLLDGFGNAFVAGIGIFIEICFLSIAIALRSRLFRNEHNRLQINHIAQLEENEKLREIARREEVAAFKNRFYDNITHEFRTPLTIIIGMAESLRLHLDKQTKNAGQLIERNGRDLLRLVNQLLALSKVQTGVLELKLVNADVIPFIKMVTESLKSLADMKNQQLTILTTPNQLFMDFDPDLLQHILTNLVSNALKFTPEAGQISIIATYKNNDEELEIKVTDNGIGISQASLPFIFDRFYRVKNEAAGAPEGSGIGLALAKELLHLMKGRIEVESIEGQGSVFSVYVPVKNTLLPTIPSEEFPVSTLPIINKDKTEPPILLLVEDNYDLVEYLRLILQDQYQLLTAANGQEGLQLAFEHLPDIVLSDVMMPGMDGLEFCQTLKKDQRTSHIPVVMLTALATVGDKIGGLQRGADGWLVKPFDRAELFATLVTMLENRERIRMYFEQGKGGVPDTELNPVLLQQKIFLDLIRSCIDAHLEDTYGVPELAKDLGMSEAQHYRKMKALGLGSPALFIRSHRLQRALDLLKTTDLTVKEIAYRTGFSDPAYFSNCFQKEFGKSPSEYRKG